MSVKHSPQPIALPRRSPIAVIKDVVTRLTPRALRRTKLEEVVDEDSEEKEETSDSEGTDAEDSDGSDSESGEDKGEEQDKGEESDEEEKPEENNDDEAGKHDDTKNPGKIYPALPTKDFEDLIKHKPPPPNTKRAPIFPDTLGTPRKPANKVKPVRLPTRVQPKRDRDTSNFIFPEIRLRRPRKVKTLSTPSSSIPKAVAPAEEKRQAKIKQEPLPPIMPGCSSTPNGGATMALVNAKDKAAYKTHFDKIFRSMVASGLDRDEAKIYADGAAMGMVNLLKGEGFGQQVATTGRLESDLWSGYFSTQQQQQTISLLAPVVPFSGNGSTRFEDWIKHFESVLNTAEWEEDRKIALLCSKLTHLAMDCVENFRQSNPIAVKSYKRVKQCLQERFHGSENRVQYCTEFKNCVHMPGESIRDYECRLQKLFLFAYPLNPKQISKELTEMREKMLMDKFIDGLSPELRLRVKYKEFKSIGLLVKATEQYAASLEETNRDRQNREFVNAVTNRVPQNSSSELQTLIQANQKMMTEMMSQTNSAIENLCSAFKKSTNVNTRPGYNKATGWNNGGYANQQQGRPYCDYCKMQGHTRARCRRDPDNQNCYRCGRPGHFSRECPSLVNHTNGGPPQQQHQNSNHPSIPRSQGN
jgi:hypothetical protein